MKTEQKLEWNGMKCNLNWCKGMMSTLHQPKKIILKLSHLEERKDFLSDDIGLHHTAPLYRPITVSKYILGAGSARLTSKPSPVHIHTSSSHIPKHTYPPLLGVLRPPPRRLPKPIHQHQRRESRTQPNHHSSSDIHARPTSPSTDSHSNRVSRVAVKDTTPKLTQDPVVGILFSYFPPDTLTFLCRKQAKMGELIRQKTI